MSDVTEDNLRKYLIQAGYRHKIISNYVNPGKTLDIGCSEGFNIFLSHAVGMDNNLNFRWGRPDNYSKVIKADVNKKFPIKSDTFDNVIASEIIEHVNSPYHFLQECKRILKPGGKLILTTPNVYYYWKIIAELRARTGMITPFGHIVEFSPRSLERLLKSVGFQIDVFRGLYMRLPLISRIDSLKFFPKVRNKFLSEVFLVTVRKAA